MPLYGRCQLFLILMEGRAVLPHGCATMKSASGAIYALAIFMLMDIKNMCSILYARALPHISHWFRVSFPNTATFLRPNTPVERSGGWGEDTLNGALVSM
jgi:hypothetical protein